MFWRSQPCTLLGVPKWPQKCQLITCWMKQWFWPICMTCENSKSMLAQIGNAAGAYATWSDHNVPHGHSPKSTASKAVDSWVTLLDSPIDGHTRRLGGQLEQPSPFLTGRPSLLQQLPFKTPGTSDLWSQTNQPSITYTHYQYFTYTTNSH